MRYLFTIAFSIFLLAFSELFNDDIKIAYTEFAKENNKKPWIEVLKYTIIAAIVSGLISLISLKISGFNEEWDFMLVSLSTMSGYLIGQSIQTDVPGLMQSDRMMLRIAYINSFIFIVMLKTVYKVDAFDFNIPYVMAAILSTVVTFLFISGIGASDARAMMFAYPIASMLTGILGTYTLFFSLGTIYFIKSYVDMAWGKITPVPVIIYFLIPYLILFISIPFIL